MPYQVTVSFEMPRDRSDVLDMEITTSCLDDLSDFLDEFSERIIYRGEIMQFTKVENYKRVRSTASRWFSWLTK